MADASIRGHHPTTYMMMRHFCVDAVFARCRNEVIINALSAKAILRSGAGDVPIWLPALFVIG